MREAGFRFKEVSYLGESRLRLKSLSEIFRSIQGFFTVPVERESIVLQEAFYCVENGELKMVPREEVKETANGAITFSVATERSKD